MNSKKEIADISASQIEKNNASIDSIIDAIVCDNNTIWCKDDRFASADDVYEYLTDATDYASRLRNIDEDVDVLAIAELIFEKCK